LALKEKEQNVLGNIPGSTQQMTEERKLLHPKREEKGR